MKQRLFAIILLMLPFTAQAVPSIQETRLDNGLRILLMEAHNVPMVSMSLVVPAGSRFDPEKRGGTASMLAAMLADHTARHEHKAWADMLDADAMMLGSAVDNDGMTLSLTVLKDVLEPGIDALTEALLMPGWSEKRFTILKEDSIAAARKELEEPGIRAAEAAAELIFSNHPYGHRSEGSLASLQAIGLSDLKALYQRQVKPDGAVLAVSGDITMDELKPLIAKALSNWKGTPETGLYDIVRPVNVIGQQADVELPTSQTQLQLLRLGPERTSPDFFPVFVLNHMLGGGGFGSKLMEEVREKRGLVYGVYSYFVPLATNGPFVISLQTRGDQAAEAERVVRSVLSTMAEGKISAKALKATKENLTGSFAQRMDSNRERVALIAMIGFYGMPLDYLSQWTRRVKEVSLQEVKDQAAIYLDPEQWNRIRIGSDLK
ncbi:zinc protease [Mariprofundus ferrinatatus]|uniref:Zinc protease n=1 Tax=Mariprofundus ferrinatatus TaxID=1921087 RepID=A0A2K8L9G0_9PROT|nr:pitrilysin family protein [Mariprofundus ferrinatatus]ATX80916.1 zinc protease [Mariprofundus ferrinatatus]